MSDTCKSCGAPIIWAETKNGKAMPVDVSPRPGGNLELKDGKCFYVKAEADVERYVSHYSSCAHAKTHRASGEKRT